MELRRELLLTIGPLVSLNLALAFGAIDILVRMGPAIERILEENVFSIIAGEELLAEFAASQGIPLDQDARVRATKALAKALAKAQRNVTEAEEGPVLTSIERELPGAFEADPESVERVVRDVRAIIAINRGAMREVDEAARRLGAPGRGPRSSWGSRRS